MNRMSRPQLYPVSVRSRPGFAAADDISRHSQGTTKEELKLMHVQGDRAACAKPPVDFKT